MLTHLPFYCRSLSYAWGQTFDDGSHLTDTIVCDGSRLKVTSSLKQALRRIRAHASAELLRLQVARPRDEFDGIDALWIDAICINQNNLQERSSQVQNMGRIFAQSKSLIVWLGEPDDDKLGEAQYELFRRLCTVMPQESLQPPPPALLPGSVNAMNSMAIREPSLHDVLHSILARPWFNRRWVIQECAPSGVAGYIMLGSANCRRDLFTSLLKTHGLMHMATPLRKTTTDQSIFQTLYMFDESQCNDPRDRVFAVRSLSRHSYMIQVDYNLDVRDTYLNLVRRVVFGVVDLDDSTIQIMGRTTPAPWGKDHDEAIMMLAIASCKKQRATDQSDSGMESWLPDWTVTKKFDSVEHRQAVELCLSQGHPKVKGRADLFLQRLIVSRTGYNYLAITGYIADPRTWPREDIMRSAIEHVKDRESLELWIESMYETAKSHCEREGGELDRMWLPMRFYRSDDQESRALVFFLRPSRNQAAVRDIPVFRLQSCILTAAPKERDVAVLSYQILGTEGNLMTLWSREEFCLE